MKGQDATKLKQLIAALIDGEESGPVAEFDLKGVMTDRKNALLTGDTDANCEGAGCTQDAGG